MPPLQAHPTLSFQFLFHHLPPSLFCSTSSTKDCCGRMSPLCARYTQQLLKQVAQLRAIIKAVMRSSGSASTGGGAILANEPLQASMHSFTLTPTSRSSGSSSSEPPSTGADIAQHFPVASAPVGWQRRCRCRPAAAGSRDGPIARQRRPLRPLTH